MPKNPNAPGEGLRFCAFCGRDENHVTFLIPATQMDGAYICDDCVGACADLLDGLDRHRMVDVPDLTRDSLPRPAEIKAMLDEYVIGQDEAKRVLSVKSALLRKPPLPTKRWRSKRAMCFFSVPPVSVRPILHKRLRAVSAFPSPLQTQPR